MAALLLILVSSAVLILASRVALRVPVENSWAGLHKYGEAAIPGTEEKKPAINWKRLLWISLLICVGKTIWLFLTVYTSGPLVGLFSLFLIAGTVVLAIERIPAIKGRFALGGLFIGTMFIWMSSPNWLSANVLAIVLVICSLIAFQLRSAFYEVAFVLGIIACLYDAINVFATGLMVESAKQSLEASSAGMFVIPASLDLKAPIVTGIGTLDIILSGLLVVLAGRAAQRRAQPVIYWAAVGGFVVGICVAGAVRHLTNTPQPALIYLIPCITAAVWLAAKRHEMQNELRRKMKKTPVEK